MLLYVGTYTQRDSNPNALKSDGIYCFTLDVKSGELIFQGVTTGIENPSYLITNPNQPYLYAVSETEYSTCVSYRIETNTGALSFLNSQSTLGASSAHLSLDYANHYALIANYGSVGQTAVVLPIQPDGSFGPPTSSVKHAGTGPNRERQEAPHGHCILPDPNNRYVFVADLGIDQLVGYKFESKTGQLTPHASFTLASGTGPRHYIFHPNGLFAYVIQELNSTISVLSYDANRGQFTTLQTVSTLPPDYRDENFCSAIHISPDGKFIYGSNRGHDSIVIYVVDETTGKLSHVGYQSTFGRTPRDFIIDPSGTFLLVANQNSDTITAFRRNRENGTLSETGNVVSVPAPTCVKIYSP